MSVTPQRQQRLTRLIELLIATVVVIAALSLWQWYQAGDSYEVVYVVLGVVLAGLGAARHWLKRESPSEATRLTSWEQALATGDDGLTALRRQIEQAFNLDDLRTLVFDLHLHYDNLAGETLERKIISLLEMCQKQGRWSDLTQNLQSARPHVQWAKVTVGDGITTPQAQRNRENLLNQVQTAWIDGVLKQSIHSEVIKLGLSYRPEAVGQRPWQLVLQQAGQPDKPVPAERGLLDLFVASGRNLLILGEPGSGKTITLLQLAEKLIEIAREGNAPLPIILNLSSWAREQKPLADWMVEEIFVQYGVARDLTRAAIAQNQFVYLLDGLDEVSGEVRDACLEAINRFKENHPAEMVVCSRIKEYEALRERLHLGAAIQIQPLSDAQVDAYLGQEGLELQAVRATLVQDAELRELAHTPLMLSLMTLAYRGMTKEELRPLADKATRRHHLFSHYVQRMFTHRPLPIDSGYTRRQATHWLSNIAHGMAQHKQSIFYIDRLQPTWLPSKWHRHYNFLFGFFSGSAISLPFGLVSGISLWIRSLIDWQTSHFFLGLAFFPVLELYFGAFTGYLFMHADGILIETINPVEKLIWQTPSLKNVVAMNRLAMVRGAFNALLFSFFVGLAGYFDDGILTGMKVGLGTLLMLWLIPLLVKILRLVVHQEENSQHLHPNQRIHSSGRNALLVGLVMALLIGVVITLTIGLIGDLETGVSLGIFLGVIIGLEVGFSGYGLFAVAQHYALRYVLAWAGMLPYSFNDRHLIAFLDAMQARIVLRRVGGGWIFIHRSLLEYFASLVATPSD